MLLFYYQQLEEKREEHVKTASRLRAEVQALWSELDMSNKEQSASSTLFFGIGSKTIKAVGGLNFLLIDSRTIFLIFWL